MLFFFWFEFENDVILQRDKYLDITKENAQLYFS